MCADEQKVRISGQLQTSGARCVLVRPGEPDVVLKCPGLGPTLVKDTPDVEVRSGSPMVNVQCEVVGRFLTDDSIPGMIVFGDIDEILVFTKHGVLRLDLATLTQLSAWELEDCVYFESKYENCDLRERFLKDRQVW